MSDKPTYLGLLNAIAVAEARAQRYLSAWISVTPDPGVRAVLRTVAAREGEHGMAFAKRIDELGFEVRERDDPDAARQMAIAASVELSDVEKMEELGLHRLTTTLDFFDDVFKDHSIDIRTGELLGRYIAEEHDTARLLCSCHARLASRPAVVSEPSADVAVLAAKVESLSRQVDELQRVVGATAGSAG